MEMIFDVLVIQAYSNEQNICICVNVFKNKHGFTNIFVLFQIITLYIFFIH